MSNRVLPITTIQGTAHDAGAAYGEAFEPEIYGFCEQEVTPNPARLAYAARCWAHVEKDAPASAEFMRGMAAGAHLPLDHITLVLLQEEVSHLLHCTAFVAAGPATVGGAAINAQNWDFPAHCYPWPGLLKLRIKGAPAMVTYQFPGQWACAGINDAGLSLVWTSTALSPTVPPEEGVPTYVVIPELLRLKTVDEAVRYIERIKLAGPFNFLLADAGGAVAVVEALPGRVCVDRSGPALCRANHYDDAEMARLSSQDLSGGVSDHYATVYRKQRMAELVRRHYGAITPSVARTIMTDRDGPWPWIHQYPVCEEARADWVLTLDSLIAVSKDRVLHTCRGGREPGPWQEVAL